MRKLPAPLTPGDAVVLIVDYQEKLAPVIHQIDLCVEAARKLIAGARVLEVPLLATEQYPAGIGPTVKPLREALGDTPVVEKTRFSACVEPLIERLRALGRANVIVAGIEAHVCVQQTVLDLLRLGYTPFVCADAISSRRPVDRDTAIERIRDAGAIITTTESVLFELLGDSASAAFRSVLKIIK